MTTPSRPLPVLPAYKRLQPLGIVLWCLYAVRLYKDGDAVNGIFRWWHPLTWLLIIILIIPCAIMGERITDVFPVRLNAYWRTRRAQVQWVTPWTNLHALSTVTMPH